MWTSLRSQVTVYLKYVWWQETKVTPYDFARFKFGFFTNFQRLKFVRPWLIASAVIVTTHWFWGVLIITPFKRPFPGCLVLLWQNQSSCETFMNMKISSFYRLIFVWYVFARRFVLKQRGKVTLKWCSFKCLKNSRCSHKYSSSSRKRTPTGRERAVSNRWSCKGKMAAFWSLSSW